MADCGRRGQGAIDGRLTVEKLGRSYAWLDTDAPSNLWRAARLERVTRRKGYIDEAPSSA